MGSRVCDIKKKFEGLCEASKDPIKIEHKPPKLDCFINSSFLFPKAISENRTISTSTCSKGNIKRSHAFRLEKGSRVLPNNDTNGSITISSSQNKKNALFTPDNNLFPSKSESNVLVLNKIISFQDTTNIGSPEKAVSLANNISFPSEKNLKDISLGTNNSNEIHKNSSSSKSNEELTRPDSLQLYPTNRPRAISTSNQFKKEKMENLKTVPVHNFTNSSSNKQIDKPNTNGLNPKNNTSDLDDSLLTNTLRKVLTSPLPSGPPPKKPPRTFAHVIEFTEDTSNHTNNRNLDVSTHHNTNSDEKSDLRQPVVKPVRSKTESQIMLKKLELALINHHHQGKIIQPNHDKKKLEKENSVGSELIKHDSKSKCEKNINGNNRLTATRKTSLPETPSNDQLNNGSGCFGVLSCSNSMELTKSSHIYDMPVEPKSQFYIDSFREFSGPSKLQSFLPKENNLSIIKANNNKILQREITEPVYAKPQTRTQRKQLKHLGLEGSDMSSVSKIIKNMNNKSENSLEKKLGNSNSSDTFKQPTLHYMSSPILEQAPLLPSTVPLSAEKKGLGQKRFLNSVNTKTFPSRSSSFDFEVASIKGLGGRSFSVDFSQDKDFDNEKIQKMVNEVYSKCLSMPQDSDSESVASTPDEGVPKPLPGKPSTTPEEAQRERQQRTAERKTYLKRVCSRATSFHRPSSSYPHLFEYLLLIGLDLNPARCKVPYIKAKYPEDANVPEGIEQLCFPDASDWPPQACADESGVGSCYCIVITHSSGSRKYGYCRRVQPEGAPICLPLAYCIVSPYKANRYFSQVLAELESRHGLPDHTMAKFIQNLHQCPFPAPGKGLIVIHPVTNEMVEILTRKLDPRQEEMDLARLLNIVRYSVFLKLFATLLLERKVVLLSYSISKLSTCVEGLCAAVYPFHWQHTLVPIVPSTMLDLCHAPTPYIIGLLKSRDPHASPHAFTNVDQVLVVDVDECRVLQSCGDESSVLPPRLCRGLREALQCAVPERSAPLSSAHNLVASEALMTLFVQLVGHYRDHIITSAVTGKREFQREGFVKSVSSNTVQSFLDWFSETAMFTAFIESRLDRTAVDACGLFEQRCVEHLSQNQAPSKSYRANINKTVKIFGDRFKEWTSS